MSITGIEVAFIGTVGRDPELRTSKAGKPWLAISVGVGSDENTQWVRVTAFNTKAEELAGQLRKGLRVYVEARDMRIDRYTGQDGRERAELKCVATRVEVLGQIGNRRPPKPKAAAEAEQSAAPPATPDWQAPPAAAAPPGGGRRPLDDLIPFGPEWR